MVKLTISNILFFILFFFSFLLFLAGVYAQKDYLDIYLNRKSYEPKTLFIERVKIYSSRYGSAQKIFGIVDNQEVEFVIGFGPFKKEGEEILIWFLEEGDENQIKLRKKEEKSFDFTSYAKNWRNIFLRDNLLFLILLLIYLKFIRKK